MGGEGGEMGRVWEEEGREGGREVGGRRRGGGEGEVGGRRGGEEVGGAPQERYTEEKFYMNHGGKFAGGGFTLLQRSCSMFTSARKAS